MLRKITDFHRVWSQERENTLKIFSHLTDESLKQRVNNDGRSIGEIVWHIIVNIGEMLSYSDLVITAPPKDSTPLTNVNDLILAYSDSSLSLLNEVSSKWHDKDLNKKIETYNEVWTLGYILEALIKHEIHHRAQLTVLMRQAGLTVPGIYGPSKEEWVKMELPPEK